MGIIPENIDETFRIGYTFNQTVTESVRIINQHFNGFDIVALVYDLERLLKIYAKEPIVREIEITDPPPVMRIEYKSYNYLNEKEGLFLSRTFRHVSNDLVAYHEIQLSPVVCRKQGIGKKLMSAFLEQYEKMSVKRIDLYAALSDGGAVWAKFGFKATGELKWNAFWSQQNRH